MRENGNLIELIVVMQYTVNVACIEENLILAKIMKENGKTYKYVIFVYNYQFYIVCRKIYFFGKFFLIVAYYRICLILIGFIL